jgi:hypothetical protein
MTLRTRVSALFAVLALGGAGASAGCNFIVGVGDYSVGDASVDTGSPSGDDSSGGDGPGLDTTAPDSGPPESGPPEAGPPVCGQGLPTGADFQALVKSCLFTVSCNPYFFSENISDCITHDYLESSPSFSCLKAIGTCAEFTACWGVANAALADCPNTGPAASCDANNRAITCTDQANGTVHDCAKLGGMCGTYVDPTSTMMTAGCLVNPTCTDTDSMDHCFGNNDYVCIGGKGYGQSCASINSTCTTVGGSSACFFANPACSSSGYSCTNNGNTLQWCSDAKQSFAFDCARAGLSCVADVDAGTGYCVAPGCTESNAANCTESCGADGKTLGLCVGGAPFPLDCTQYGFAKCATAMDMSTTPPTTYAYCQN